MARVHHVLLLLPSSSSVYINTVLCYLAGWPGWLLALALGLAQLALSGWSSTVSIRLCMRACPAWFFHVRRSEGKAGALSLTEIPALN